MLPSVNISSKFIIHSGNKPFSQLINLFSAASCCSCAPRSVHPDRCSDLYFGAKCIQVINRTLLDTLVINGWFWIANTSDVCRGRQAQVRDRQAKPRRLHLLWLRGTNINRLEPHASHKQLDVVSTASNNEMLSKVLQEDNLSRCCCSEL